MTIQNELIEKTMKILSQWNPLGPGAQTLTDLDNYRTEAIDILFNIDLRKSNPATVVRQVLNQAFNLSLSIEECTAVGNQIQELMKE